MHIEATIYIYKKCVTYFLGGYPRGSNPLKKYCAPHPFGTSSYFRRTTFKYVATGKHSYSFRSIRTHLASHWNNILINSYSFWSMRAHLKNENELTKLRTNRQNEYELIMTLVRIDQMSTNWPKWVRIDLSTNWPEPFQMTQSVTIESPDQIRSSTFEYDYPDRVQAYHYRTSRFDKMLYAQICYSFFFTFITIKCAVYWQRMRFWSNDDRGWSRFEPRSDPTSK